MLCVVVTSVVILSVVYRVSSMLCVVTLSVVMVCAVRLSVIINVCCYTECHYAEYDLYCMLL